MKDLEREKIINYFNYNIALEHSAIIQYLFHAYTIGEAETENEIEEIAREEMRHLRMFAHKVVELGGEPAISERASVFLHAPTLEDLMQLDIDAELMAIQEYSKQLKDLSDESAKRILSRVISDEDAHSKIFTKMKENLKQMVKDSSSVKEQERLEIAQLLNDILQRQYKKILEELYQSFITRFKNPHLSDELEQKAIDKMKHFGWIAEELTEKGYQIDVSLPKIDKVKDSNDIVNYNIKEEMESKEQFLSLSQKTQLPDLQWILERIANREIHYTDLKKFLENNQLSEKDYGKILSAFTVGSLFKK
ncbi:ferritin-like domain-containing protein [Sulfurihydrogenibium subterraneum]|uniref:ferritin-like domain-containing protein n=1 Tax=Sulfurihydrogenibium subterraneum TaxID=171121 RepID=UPI000491D8E3|nr:ferritin-like domain-containing protein [Sulfurihydrogenibium subterraneum]